MKEDQEAYHMMELIFKVVVSKKIAIYCIIEKIPATHLMLRLIYIQIERMNLVCYSPRQR